MRIFYRLLFSLIVAISYSYAGSDILISAKDAVKLIGKPNVVFVTGDSESVFKTGHIKGSVDMYAHHLHHSDKTGHLACSPLFMCPKEAEKYIGSKGIGNNTLVIAYDNFRGPNATGVYAFFRSFGHEKIKILNGGRAAIMKIDPQQKIYDAIKSKLQQARKNKASKQEIDSLQAKLKAQEKKRLVVMGEGEKVVPKKYVIDPKKIDYDFIAGKDEILKAVKDILKNGKKSQYVIIDARAFNEIMGDRKMDNVARGGHIPGSKFIEWKKITDFKDELSFEDKAKMQALFDKYGVTKDKKVYAYCHVGAGRSSHIITALKILGYKDAKVYTGSWDEWGNDMNLPIRR